MYHILIFEIKLFIATVIPRHFRALKAMYNLKFV